MKNKTLAGIFALVFGSLGVHRFYLGQVGLGIAYLLFFWFPLVWLIALIDAIVLLSMDQSTFDQKYNRRFLGDDYRNSNSDFEGGHYENQRERNRYQENKNHHRENRYKDWEQGERKKEYSEQRKRTVRSAENSTPRHKKANPFRATGVQKFKDYDFDAAIEDFEKALEIEPNDVAVHFNIACAYSITEQKKEAFYHLDQAVKLGFKDFEKIQNHDSLAFLRIQKEFERFKKNNYQLSPSNSGSEKKSQEKDNLLEQLQKLAELREKGLLTDEEFSNQKRRLLD